MSFRWQHVKVCFEFFRQVSYDMLVFEVGVITFGVIMTSYVLTHVNGSSHICGVFWVHHAYYEINHMKSACLALSVCAT